MRKWQTSRHGLDTLPIFCLLATLMTRQTLQYHGHGNYFPFIKFSNISEGICLTCDQECPNGTVVKEYKDSEPNVCLRCACLGPETFIKHFAGDFKENVTFLLSSKPYIMLGSYVRFSCARWYESRDPQDRRRNYFRYTKSTTRTIPGVRHYVGHQDNITMTFANVTMPIDSQTKADSIVCSPVMGRTGDVIAEEEDSMSLFPIKMATPVLTGPDKVYPTADAKWTCVSDFVILQTGNLDEVEMAISSSNEAGSAKLEPGALTGKARQEHSMEGQKLETSATIKYIPVRLGNIKFKIFCTLIHRAMNVSREATPISVKVPLTSQRKELSSTFTMVGAIAGTVGLLFMMGFLFAYVMHRRQKLRLVAGAAGAGSKDKDKKGEEPTPKMAPKSALKKTAGAPEVAAQPGTEATSEVTKSETQSKAPSEAPSGLPRSDLAPPLVPPNPPPVVTGPHAVP